MPKLDVAFAKDAAERIFWTAAEAGLAVAITIAASIPKWWVACIAPALAFAKTYVAKHVAGGASSAALPVGPIGK